MNLLRRHRITCLLAGLLCLVLVNSALAARFLTAIFQVDGQTVLESAYEDDDWFGPPPGAQVVWRYLAKEPLGVERKSLISVDRADPLKAKLRGHVVIRIQHVDRLIIERETSELRLIRTTPSSERWFVPTEEVERVAKGLPPPNDPRLLLSVVLVLVTVIAAWLMYRMWAQSVRG